MQRRCRRYSMIPPPPGNALSTPSSPKKSGARAPDARLKVTTACSSISFAGLERHPIRSPGRTFLHSPTEVFAFAHGTGISAREPSSITIGARLSCLSSFFKFLIRMDIVNANPCDAVERPRSQPSPPRGLSGEQVRRILDVIPDTVKGRRDRAIVLTLVLTGRRRSEVLNLKACDINLANEIAFYNYRGKGGKKGRRELPLPALEAIRGTLADIGKDLSTTNAHESLWQAGAGVPGVTSATFYNRFRRYQDHAGLRPSGVHILRHTAAKLRRDAGETVESVSQFLDHSSLGVTTTYLRRLEGVNDGSWRSVANVLGV